MKFADLHIHTDFSDGTFSCEQVVHEARQVGLSCISITDHDSVEALDSAITFAADNLEIIPGVELSAECGDQEIHVLGYLIDYKDSRFLEMLQSMCRVRVQRIYDICAKLKQQGIEVDPEDVFSLAGKGSVGRLHVARAMCEKGAVSCIPQAFYDYIGDKGSAYVGKLKMSVAEAIALIRGIKGIPVLAHPHIIRDQSRILEFIKDGIMGLEVFYPEYSASQIQRYSEIAQEHHLLITGGSDCHGTARQESCLGKIKLAYEYVEKLKEAKCALM
ncbi:MAG: PHP domain-containing protein [Candidatus Omnitrophota bacterium]